MIDFKDPLRLGIAYGVHLDYKCIVSPSANLRVHFTSWHISVRDLASLLGSACHPVNEWMYVGILITGKQ